MNPLTFLQTVLLFALWGAIAGTPDAVAVERLPIAVDLEVGKQAAVKLCDGTSAPMKLLNLREKRDSLPHAVRRAQVTVEIIHRVTGHGCDARVTGMTPEVTASLHHCG